MEKLLEEQWTELWKQCLKVEDFPNVDVKLVKPKLDNSSNTKQAMLFALNSIARYTLKPFHPLFTLDTSIEEIDKDWLVKFTNETYKSRTVSSGGVFKQYLKDKDVEKDSNNLIHINETANREKFEDEQTISFIWNPSRREYRLLEHID